MGELEEIKKLLETTLSTITSNLSLHQRMILKLQKENLDLKETIKKQSTELNTSINENRSETSKLRDTTIQLNKVLSSSQKRGQWGERMVEDILGILGLVENINYKKQSMVESGERPDFTFLLPKEKMINMDVKFPLEHYENYLESDDRKIINEAGIFWVDVFVLKQSPDHVLHYKLV